MANSSELEECLSVGLEVFLDVQPGRQGATRYPGRVRGWEVGRFILLGMRQSGGMPAVRPGGECVTRFMYDGEVWGFTARLGETTSNTEFPLVQLHWPQQVARLQVRKHERAAIQMPCSVDVADGSSADGTIGDLSGGGCSVTSTCDLAVGDLVHLSFHMPDGGHVNRRPVIIRNRRADASGMFNYGCQFQEEKEEDRGITLFVARKIASDRGEEAPHPQLLVLSRNDDDAEVARHALRNSPYEVIASTGILDLGHRLHTCKAVGIIMSYEQKELSAIEVLSLIRESPGMEEFPLFFYGGGEGLHEQAMTMGATGCLESISSANEVLAHLPEIDASESAADESSVEEPLSLETSADTDDSDGHLDLDTNANDEDEDEDEGDEDGEEIDMGGSF